MSRMDAEEVLVLETCGEHVCCVDVSPKRLLWCARAGRAAMLHMWESCEAQPSAVPLVELGFVPSLISSLEGKIIVVGRKCVALFTVECPTFPSLGNLEGDETSLRGRGGTGGKFIVTEEFLCSDIPSNVTHISWSPDGTLAALSSPEKLILINCRIGYYNENDSDVEFSPCLFVDCTRWYGDCGAAFTAFAASRLFVLSPQNHLVMTHFGANDRSVGYNDNDMCYFAEPIFERDGHIIAHAQHVTCFLVLGSEEGYLAVGLSYGTLKLLQQDSMEVFFTINVTKQLYRMSSRPQFEEGREEHLEVLNVAVGDRYMVVMRPDAVIYYDKKSMVLLEEKTVFLSGNIPALSACAGNGSWCMWSSQNQELLYYPAAVEMFTGANNTTDMVHAQVPLPSHLLKPLSLPYQQQQQGNVNTVSTGQKMDKNKNKNKLLTNKPVTFGHPIKSSGYANNIPWSVQQQQRAKEKEKSQKGNRLIPSIASPLRFKALPLPGHPFKLMSTANNILSSSPIHQAVVTSTIFSANGSALLTASGDCSAHWLRYPVAKNGGNGILMEAHTSPVNTIDVNLSLDAPFVATGSSDGMLAVWQPTKRESPYILQKIGRDVRAVKFFYTDKFLCYASCKTISFCRYALDNGGGELHRKRNESKMEPVLEFSVDSAHNVVAIDAINYFTSNILIWAGSNKSVGTFDVSVGQNIQVIEEAHSRPIHHITMMTSSRYASPNINLLHMYLTAGLDSTVRVWDLRQRRSVRQLALHRNSATPVGMALSPNGAMVAVGSESRAVFIYDLNSGAVVDTIDVGDTPTALTWHPIESVLAVGTTSGGMQLIGQR